MYLYVIRYNEHLTGPSGYRKVLRVRVSYEATGETILAVGRAPEELNRIQ